jgi:GNAT superfamily N-acetyltransferase
MEAREALADDWEVWRELRLRALKDSPDSFASTYEREIAFTEADWRDRLAGTAVLVYVDDLPIAQGAGFEDQPGQTMVVSMWTTPEARRQGAGRLVLDWVVRQAIERGRQPHLCVTTTNPAARGLYEAAEFAPDGLTTELRPGILAEHLIR